MTHHRPHFLRRSPPATFLFVVCAVALAGCRCGARSDSAPEPGSHDGAAPGEELEPTAATFELLCTSAHCRYQLASDSEGNTIVAGSFVGALDLGGETLESDDGIDLFVAKFDAPGRHVWSRRYGGPGDHHVRGLALDGGNLLLTGEFSGELDFGLGALEARDSTDVYLAALDAQGEPLWNRHFASQAEGTFPDWGTAYPAGVAVDGEGTIALAGWFMANAIDFGGGPLTFEGDHSPANGFLAKLDSAGAHLWSHNFGGEFADEYVPRVRAIGSTPRGDVLIAGEFGNEMNLGGDALTTTGMTNEEGEVVAWKTHCFVAAFANDGDPMWSTSLAEDYCEVQGFRVRRDGQSVIALSRTWREDGDERRGSVYLAGLDAQGQIRWSRSLAARTGAEVDPLVVRVELLASGRVLVAGHFSGSIELGDDRLESRGDRDLYLVTLDEDGALVEADHLGSGGDVELMALSKTPDDEPLLFGRFTQSLPLGHEQLETDSPSTHFLARLPSQAGASP